MEEFLLLQMIVNQNEIAKRNLKRQRRHLRDTMNPFDLPENEFRNLYR